MPSIVLHHIIPVRHEITVAMYVISIRVGPVDASINNCNANTFICLVNVVWQRGEHLIKLVQLFEPSIGRSLCDADPDKSG